MSAEYSEIAQHTPEEFKVTFPAGVRDDLLTIALVDGLRASPEDIAVAIINKYINQRWDNVSFQATVET